LQDPHANHHMTVHQGHGEWHEEMQRGGAHDGQPEYLVGRELGGDEAAGNLRHQIAPEEGRVHMALHGDRPVHEHSLQKSGNTFYGMSDRSSAIIKNRSRHLLTSVKQDSEFQIGFYDGSVWVRVLLCMYDF